MSWTRHIRAGELPAEGEKNWITNTQVMNVQATIQRAAAPPRNPARERKRTAIGKFWEKPKHREETQVARLPASRMGRRPTLSLIFPQIGPDRNCATAKEDARIPA